MINKSRLNKAIQKAKEHIAIKKLAEKNLGRFIDNDGKKAVFQTFCVGVEGVTTAQQKEHDENEKLCEMSGLKYYAIFFHDSMPPDF